MPRRFHTLDVFTGRKLAGNPLAVVHDCDDLDTAAMQSIAREFNLSETVFIMPPDDPINTAKIRIFTPGAELPFAGHPTVGTAILLATLRAPEMMAGQGIVIALEEKIGLVSVEVRQQKGRPARAVFGLPKLPARLEQQRNASLISRALGLDDADIATQTLEPADFAAGPAFTMVGLTSLDALARAKSLATDAFEVAFGQSPHPCCYLYVKTGERAWRTRMFAPGMGVMEDPATGSAAAAFAGVLMALEKPLDGEHQHIIAQGIEMGRPSEIVLTLQVSGGKLESASIGGEAVVVSEGALHL
jgi:trans-2,3-dihydro-3-hydroxyanthranilate isomerase